MNLSDEEKQALSDQNRALNKHFEDVFAQVFGAYSTVGSLAYADGTPVHFDIGDKKNLYRYYAHPTTAKRYCWTPWKDTKGWYWAFNYVPSKGGGRLLIKNAVKFRKRKAAKQRATDRFNKDNS